MKKNILFVGLLLLIVTSCARRYELTGVERSRVLIDGRFDVGEDLAVAEFMRPYRLRVDSVANRVVGQSARRMSRDRPESELSNLVADILVWGAGELLGERVDFGVYNMGGIRASLPEGDVTFGDVVEIAPFENKLCTLTLSGEMVMQLFREIAHSGGEGVSRGVELVISRDRKLKSALLNGRPVDPLANYRIATVDYVAQGNDRMEAFKQKTNLFAPQENEYNSRFVIMDYFKSRWAQGIVVDARLEGRIRIE